MQVFSVFMYKTCEMMIKECNEPGQIDSKGVAVALFQIESKWFVLIESWSAALRVFYTLDWTALQRFEWFCCRVTAVAAMKQHNRQRQIHSRKDLGTIVLSPQRGSPSPIYLIRNTGNESKTCSSTVRQIRTKECLDSLQPLRWEQVKGGQGNKLTGSTGSLDPPRLSWGFALLHKPPSIYCCNDISHLTKIVYNDSSAAITWQPYGLHSRQSTRERSTI